MRFSVTCPFCDTEFPVDSDKVPDGGVNAICSFCQEVFLVKAPAAPESLDEFGAAEGEASLAVEMEAPADPEAPPEGDEAAATEEFDQLFEPVVEDEAIDTGVEVEGEAAALEEDQGFGGGLPADDTMAVEGFEMALEEEPAVAEEEEAGEGDEEVGLEEPAAPKEAAPAVPAFGQRDPHDKAKRLARVLVQDIIAYNQELHATAMANNRLKEDMEEEVAKSWEEYIDQVGSEIAESTSYFRDALNEILADGQEVFDGPP